MDATTIKLKERVKELRCLYDLSKIALEAGNDLNMLLSKTLTILPNAMQYPELAEVSITTETMQYVSRGFSKSQSHITSSKQVGKKDYVVIKVGYRSSEKKKESQEFFFSGRKKLD